MAHLDGIWRLVQAQAWDENEQPLPPPYGEQPMGQIMIAHGRLLAVLCKGDPGVEQGKRGFTSYGGPFTFDGTTLDTTVDVASDPARIGGHQVRTVVTLGPDRIMLKPPLREYAGGKARRELIWERVWQPSPTT